MSEWRERYGLELPADLLAGRRAVQSVLSWFMLQGHSPMTVKAWKLPLTEAVNNAILHGGNNQAQPVVRISAATSPAGTEVSISDGGFYVPAPDAGELPVDPLDHHGRGSFLIAQGVDAAEHHNDANGHTLTLRWTRTPSQSGGVLNAGRTEEALDSLAQRLGDAYESVTAYSEFAGLLATTSNFQEILGKVRIRLAHTVPHDQFILRMAEGEELKLATPVQNFPVAIPKSGPGLEAEVARTRLCHVCRQPGEVPANDPLRPGTGPLVIVACGTAQGTAGTLTLTRAAGAPQFTAAQLAFTQAAADFLGTAQSMADLWSRRAEQLKLEQELTLAAKIQASLFPQTVPDLAFWDVAGRCQPSRAMGGDYYDWIPQEDGSCLVLVADVMGKGMPAALVASILRSSWRALAGHTKEPAQLLSALNHQMASDLAALEVFITAVLVRLGPKGDATYACAGHCPLLQSSKNSAAFVRHEIGGPPLGVLAGVRYQAIAISVAPGDSLYAFTDGCCEIDRARGFEAGLVHFEQQLAAAAALSPAEGVAQVLRGLESSATLDLPDDCTLVALHYAS